MRVGLIGVALSSVVTLTAAPCAAQLRSRVYASGFDRPVAFVQDPTDRTVQFVAEQGGRIRALVNGAVQPVDFLDLRGVVSVNTPEQGLRGLAFTRDMAAGGRFFVSFTDQNGNLVVARFRRASAQTADPASRFDLRWGGGGAPRFIAEPTGTNIGGHLEWHADGHEFLTVGLGDGGVPGAASDDTQLLGKILDLDITVPDSDPTGYTSRVIRIRDVVNVRGFHYDDPARGGNGRLLAGYSDPTAERIVEDGFPLWSYTQSHGTIVGGPLYRGHRLGTTFFNRYFYADPVLGTLWSFDLRREAEHFDYYFNHSLNRPYVVDVRSHSSELGIGGARRVVAFGLDADGELYLVTSDGFVLAVDTSDPPRPAAVADTDRDNKSDPLIWRASTGTWYSAASTTGYSSGFVKQFGNAALGDVPFTGDVDADGAADLIVWRASTGTWHWTTAASGYTAGGIKQFGNQTLGDVPFVADFDGDSRADFAVWRASTGTWYWTTSGSGYTSGSSRQFGNQGLGDVPFAADIDGDRKADLIVWRAATGSWYWATSSTGYINGSSQSFGDPSLNQRPFVGDVDGDRKADLILWGQAVLINSSSPQDGIWQFLTSSSGYTQYGWDQWGNQTSGDVPLVGDMNGDGRADFVIWRPSDGGWYIMGRPGALQFGNAALGDVPVMK